MKKQKTNDKIDFGIEKYSKAQLNVSKFLIENGKIGLNELSDEWAELTYQEKNAYCAYTKRYLQGKSKVENMKTPLSWKKTYYNRKAKAKKDIINKIEEKEISPLMYNETCKKCCEERIANETFFEKIKRWFLNIIS